MARKTIPNDIIPFNGGKLILTEILPDGSKGKIASTFENFLISVTPTTSRVSVDLTVGEGSAMPFPQSESQTYAIVVNAYNTEFHALITGRTNEIKADIGLTEEFIKIVKAGDAGSETYSHTFATEDKPVANADGEYILTLTDKYGYALEDVTGATGALTEGQFTYDSDTGVLSVSSDYENEDLTILYYFSSDEVSVTEASETLETKTFRIDAISKVQSAKGKQKMQRWAYIDRAVFTGDVPDEPQQQEINVNMTYNVISQTPSAGNKAYGEKVYAIKE